ncbi:MAG TPA: MGMT family protein [Acidimicrobiia bacterium]|nr:MGMT family protein [Acidimicrobiia bacterium]
MTEFEQAVLFVLSSLQPGETMTYGEVAEVAGFPGRARHVGRILAETDEDIPWWRVVGAGGRLVSPSAQVQQGLLMAEGHQVADLKVKLR